MWSVSRYMDRHACAHDLFCSAKYNIEFSFQQSERLLEIVTVRRQVTAGRNKHVDQAKPASCIFASQENGVRIARDPQMRNVLVRWLCGRKFALRVVGWDAETGMPERVGFVDHFFTPRISFRWMRRGAERDTDNHASSDLVLERSAALALR
jgi:hypothetical protein